MKNSSFIRSSFFARLGLFTRLGLPGGLIALYLLLATAAFAQAPNKFRYQAVARDQNGAVINGNISIRLAGVSASSLNGPGGEFSSVSGPALVTGSGNVGIGVSNPGHRLEVNGSGYFTSQSNDGVSGKSMASGWAGVDGTGTNGAAGGHFYADAPGQPLLVSSNASGKGTGIEMFTPTAGWETYIDPAKDYNFANNGTLRAWIFDTDGSYHNSSDRRLKKDIQTFSNVLPRLSKLQAYTYHMKDAEADSPISVGFMAQEVEEQFPQLVTEKEGFKTLCYDHFAVLSVQAIKEQQVQIEDLKRQIEELKQMLQELAEK